jgi:hypothetical protein
MSLLLSEGQKNEYINLCLKWDVEGIHLEPVKYRAKPMMGSFAYWETVRTFK